MAARIPDADAEAELGLSETDGLAESQPVGGDDGDLGVLPEGVEEQLGARLTSDPFSSVSITSAVAGPRLDGAASHISTPRLLEPPVAGPVQLVARPESAVAAERLEIEPLERASP